MFELPRTAPFIVRGEAYDAVIDGVAMYVVQPGEVSTLEGEVCLAEILPKTGTAGGGIAQVQLLRRETVKLADAATEVFGIFLPAPT